MQTEEIEIRANTGEPIETFGRARIHHFTQNEKTMRALKRMGAFWLAALVSVLLPVVHFVLVPLFGILGLVFFFRVMKTDGELIGGKIQCSTCKTEVVIGRQLLEWPLKEICQNCARVLRIDRKN